ncbi:MAG TPA: hypothetical protein VJJ25_01360 [Nitrosopumilaceae archaeon]|nr:hypothetical protein [Nitrosopumilaceae archaeon]
MAIPAEIKQIIEKQIELMIDQTKAYLPFIKLAFPRVKDLSDACFTLIVGTVLPTFVTQFAMRMKFPTKQDFAEFGTITEKYRSKIKEMF